MEKIKKNMMKKNNNLSKYACLDNMAERFKQETEDIRTPFFRDIDRIIYSLSYIRYIDKTQVFSYQKNNHLSKRMSHVQFVSKIARTIGRALNLNEDLIEAAALGHDLGHIPFGHVGETHLNNLSLKHGEGYFNHNIHSVRILMNIENHGQGKNITYQVLDAIMCHNGEIADFVYVPVKKTKEIFLKEYYESYTNIDLKLRPSTLEGCVVRISDLIGYLGRDIEDGIRVGLIKKSDIPFNISQILGTNNKEIVNTIIMDILKNSYDKNYIKLSDNIYNAIMELKKFNYNHIYFYAYNQEERKNIEKMFNEMFEYYLKVLERKDMTSPIFYSYLKNMTEDYNKNTPARIVIDYIAGMTDEYFMTEYKKINKEKYNGNNKKEG